MNFNFSTEQLREQTWKLTPAERGVAFFLLAHYCETETPLPNNPTELARIGGVADALNRTEIINAVLQTCFYQKSGVWRHKEADRLITISQERARQGAKGGKGRRQQALPLPKEAQPINADDDIKTATDKAIALWRKVESDYGFTTIPQINPNNPEDVPDNIAKRLMEVLQMKGVHEFNIIIEAINKSPYLQGKNDKEKHITLDMILNRKNGDKVLFWDAIISGQYNENKVAVPTKETSEAQPTAPIRTATGEIVGGVLQYGDSKIRYFQLLQRGESVVYKTLLQNRCSRIWGEAWDKDDATAKPILTEIDFVRSYSQAEFQREAVLK